MYINKTEQIAKKIKRQDYMENKETCRIGIF